MITVKVTTKSGESWTTGINTDLQGAQKYFIGQCFPRADETIMGPVISVEELKPFEIRYMTAHVGKIQQGYGHIIKEFKKVLGDDNQAVLLCNINPHTLQRPHYAVLPEGTTLCPECRLMVLE